MLSLPPSMPSDYIHSSIVEQDCMGTLINGKSGNCICLKKKKEQGSACFVLREV